MYSIASTFDGDGQQLWDELESRCKSGCLRRTPIPHFSWQTAESYEIEPLKAELDNLCRNIRPFTFHTSGLGVFPKERKIIFLIIVKDRALLDLHEMIWENTFLYARQPNMLYAPENWVPHISLNLTELSDDDFACAIRDLTVKQLDFTLTVRNIGLLYLTMTSSGVDSMFDLNDPTAKRQ